MNIKVAVVTVGITTPLLLTAGVAFSDTPSQEPSVIAPTDQPVISDGEDDPEPVIEPAPTDVAVDPSLGQPDPEVVEHPETLPEPDVEWTELPNTGSDEVGC